MEYFENEEWLKEKFGEKIELKYRIKETIHYYKNEENCTFYPQFCIMNLPNDYKIEYQGLDEENNNWVYLYKAGFKEIENARKCCKDTKPYIDKKETKYHEL